MSDFPKFSKPGFNSTWTVNFQMFKLDLEKAEEPEIKLPTPFGSLKKQESSRKTSTSALLITSKPSTLWITTNWKNSSRWEYQTTLPASWESVCRSRSNSRTGHGTVDWLQIRKAVCQGYIWSPSLCNLYSEYIKWNARLDEAQAGIKIVGRNINNPTYADDTTLMAESEELKSLLMKVKEDSEKVGLKLNI